ncbi:caffeic acid 3-O-methyltransferase-like [Malus domestica]|uniref:caffeic acid 3-O-methyltransferase-like n=1 Tax=Malus domestica TaxID=3750 RepID=UPI0039768B1B
MVLKAAIELGVLDIIHRAGAGALLSPSQIASQLRSLHNPNASSVLDRMLCLLSAYSILTCSTIQANGKVIRVYGLAPVSKYFMYQLDAVLEGGLPFSQAYGMNVVDYIGRDDRLGGLFTDSMKEFNLIFKKEILEIYTGFEGLHTLVDVGGGDGTILNMIISKHPAIKGINYDLPSVVEKSPSHPGIEHIAGDMFVRIPKGDAIFMKWILHGWDDDRCLMILKNCYEALPDNGKVIVVDMVIQEAPGTSFSAKSLFLFDVYLMNTNVMGKERTERELQSMAKAAGFSDI